MNSIANHYDRTATTLSRRLVAVLAVVCVATVACGSDVGQTTGGGTGDACRSLAEVRRLGERYNELADDVVVDAVRTAPVDPTVDPDVDRDELGPEAHREMLIELDSVMADLLDAHRDAADAAPDLAADLEALADLTEVTFSSWRELLERPDADPGELLDWTYDGDEGEAFEAWIALERLKGFTVDECGFEFVPDE